jgi:hypothetical protein
VIFFWDFFLILIVFESRASQPKSKLQDQPFGCLEMGLEASHALSRNIKQQ